MRCVREFDVAALEAEAIWGAQAKKKLRDEMRLNVAGLQVSISMYVNYLSDGGDKEFAVKLRRDIAALPGADDELSKKIDASITAIDEFLKPKLRR